MKKNAEKTTEQKRDGHPVDLLLEGLQVRERQNFRNMTLYALFRNEKKRTSYLTLSRAFSKGVLKVTEVDTSGSVPELKVINEGDKRVLLLDGEELEGAKQNRILNTSILLKKHSELIIPVSCTESGRWDRRSTFFRDSGYVASREIRQKKSRSVSRSLAMGRHYHSDQSEVWDSVEELFMRSGTGSTTRAMRDAYEQRKERLQEYLEAFTPAKGQHGMIVMIDGHVAGMEYLSSAGAFREVFPKLIKSYAFEAMIREDHKKREQKDEEGSGQPGEGAAIREFEAMESFRELVKQSRKTPFKSPGHGWDHRIVAGKGTSVNGNALVYRGEVIHLAVFGDSDPEEGRDRRHRRREEGNDLL
jgi:hypothetical protein